ncbi:threonylcarbamoyl-AMP synthase [Rhodobacterales bacterium 52_120_T64]|nr:threonylcarbamoyl-AMP synthase [Rhodobacterales bacterium 52_120_T64]
MINTTQRLNPNNISAAAALLRGGDLVAFPTETVYGLGADARNDRAVAGIFAAKSRPQFNPLIVHVADLAAAEEIAELPTDARALAAAFWPGPLTLILPTRNDSGLSDLVTAGLGTVGVRVPFNPIAKQLLKEFGGPVAAPSANPSGKISPTSADHVLDGLSGKIAAVVDGGPCDVGLESTIIGFDNGPVLLRAGGLPSELIAAALGMEVRKNTDDAISAPGQLKSHYAPKAKLRLNAEAPQADEVWLGFGSHTFDVQSLNLSQSGDLTEAATNLFAHMHALDKVAAKIAVGPIPSTGLGLAINDRLERAAS